jgi:spermidine/putrescine transport system permease protein
VRKLLGAWTAVVLAALYAPIAVMVAFSFNASPFLVWKGFTLDWYAELFRSGDIRDALQNTLILAALSTTISTVLGTLAALAARASFRGKRLYVALVTLPVTVPDIVLAIAVLALFRAVGAPLSVVTAALAHSTFNLAYVALVVSARLEGLDPSLERAAQDLGCTRWAAFWRVTFPAILPAVASGALLAFTLSFDDFVITYFTVGAANPTLPVLIYSRVKFGVTPEINAISTVLLAVSLALIAASLKLSKAPVSGGRR